MFNLFDILQSQGQTNLETFGRQVGLSPDQTRKAMEALLPALTMGLQRNAALDPTGFGRLFGLVDGSARPGGAFRPPSQPDLLLTQLFGSPMISQAVLQQAAAVSGVGNQALRQMLPVMAGMIVAGIVHILLNQPAQAPQQPAAPPPGALPAAAFWTEWMAGLAKAGGVAPSPPPPPAPLSPPPRAATSGAPFDVVQQMFQTGADVQEQNVRAMQAIFDTFWKPADGSRTSSPPSGRDIRRGGSEPGGRKPRSR